MKPTIAQVKKLRDECQDKIGTHFAVVASKDIFLEICNLAIRAKELLKKRPADENKGESIFYMDDVEISIERIPTRKRKADIVMNLDENGELIH